MSSGSSIGYVLFFAIKEIRGDDVNGDDCKNDDRITDASDEAGAALMIKLLSFLQLILSSLGLILILSSVLENFLR